MSESSFMSLSSHILKATTHCQCMTFIIKNKNKTHQGNQVTANHVGA